MKRNLNAKSRVRSGLRRGVTLIETLAALAVIAVIAPVLARVWVLTVSRSGMVAEALTAATLAEAKLTEILDAGAYAGESSGDFSPEHPGYAWRLDRTTWSGNDGFEQLDLTVEWDHGPRRRSLALTTLLPTTAE